MARHAVDISDAILGGGLIALAVAVAVPTMNMTVGFSYDGVGPRGFPYAIAVLLFLGGASILAGAFAGREPPPSEGPVDWPAIAIVSGSLLFQMALIRQLGWIPVAALAFTAVAWAFGNRMIFVSLAFGLALSCATYALFNYGLGLKLPPIPL